MSRSPIIGRFLKDGSTEYRAKDLTFELMAPSGETGHILLGGTGLGFSAIEGTYPTRKAAIERIEQLLCGGVTI